MFCLNNNNLKNFFSSEVNFHNLISESDVCKNINIHIILSNRNKYDYIQQSQLDDVICIVEDIFLEEVEEKVDDKLIILDRNFNQEKRKIIKNMLSLQMDLEIIARIMGMKKDEIISLIYN